MTRSWRPTTGRVVHDTASASEPQTTLPEPWGRWSGSAASRPDSRRCGESAFTIGSDPIDGPRSGHRTAVHCPRSNHGERTPPVTTIVTKTFPVLGSAGSVRVHAGEVGEDWTTQSDQAVAGGPEGRPFQSAHADRGGRD